ncbi:translation initiation factor IF-2-like [Mustela erminea]|uniref:translation initiation factor IF-2-like n=1 Tax=Mustela erminea TaxID=36723 RepID=UPI001386BE1C|nr:translation initiation factor IF-2-like [Mustela erminea]
MLKARAVIKCNVIAAVDRQIVTYLHYIVNKKQLLGIRCEIKRGGGEREPTPGQARPSGARAARGRSRDRSPPGLRRDPGAELLRSSRAPAGRARGGPSRARLLSPGREAAPPLQREPYGGGEGGGGATTTKRSKVGGDSPGRARAGVGGVAGGGGWGGSGGLAGGGGDRRRDPAPAASRPAPEERSAAPAARLAPLPAAAARAPGPPRTRPPPPALPPPLAPPSPPPRPAPPARSVSRRPGPPAGKQPREQRPPRPPPRLLRPRSRLAPALGACPPTVALSLGARPAACFRGGRTGRLVPAAAATAPPGSRGGRREEVEVAAG